LCSTVQFVDALDDMMYTNVANRQLKTKSKIPSLFVEIGPHAALAGPIKQYKTAREELEHLAYHSILKREEDASSTALGVAGSLWAMGVPVKLNKVSLRGRHML
jgi:acyl transferase domain-containing protein